MGDQMKRARRNPEYDGGMIGLGFAIIYGLFVVGMLTLSVAGVM